MNSWAVTWGIIQALCVLLIASWIIDFVTSDWFLRDFNWFKLITGLIVVGGLLLAIILKLDETNERFK